MKKNLITRALMIMLILGFLIAVVGACGQETTTTTTATQDGTTTGEEQPDDPFYIEGAEGITFTYWSTMRNYQSQYFTTMAEHPYYQWLEEKTGITIEFIHPSWEQRDQQLTLMISSREFYDFLESAWYPGGPQAGINEECFIDLLPYLDDYMPNYKLALYDEGNELNSWEWSVAERDIFQPQPQSPAFAEKMFTFEGQLWAMTSIWRDEIPAVCGPIIRQDWLEEADLAIPQTLDELEQVLAAFKERGAIPMALPSAGYVIIWEGAMLISAFDTGGYFHLGTDGRTIEDHTYIKEEFKEYLMLMRDWYAAGYIDPDFMNSDWDSTWSKMVEDKLGIWLNYWGNPENIMDAYMGDENFDIEPMPLPRKSNDQVLRAKQASITEPLEWITITTSCEYPKIAAQWLDKYYTIEAMLRMSYGIEGETYEMVDGVPVYLESMFADDNEPQEVKQQILLKVGGPQFNSTRANILLSQRGDNTQTKTAMEASLVWGGNAEMKMRIPYTIFEDDDWGVQENLVTEVATYADPMVIRFITGQESIEDKWDEYVQTCINLGIREARDVWQSSYDKMLEIADEVN